MSLSDRFILKSIDRPKPKVRWSYSLFSHSPFSHSPSVLKRIAGQYARTGSTLPGPIVIKDCELSAGISPREEHEAVPRSEGRIGIAVSSGRRNTSLCGVEVVSGSVTLGITSLSSLIYLLVCAIHAHCADYYTCPLRLFFVYVGLTSVCEYVYLPKPRSYLSVRLCTVPMAKRQTA